MTTRLFLDDPPIHLVSSIEDGVSWNVPMPASQNNQSANDDSYDITMCTARNVALEQSQSTTKPTAEQHDSVNGEIAKALQRVPEEQIDADAADEADLLRVRTLLSRGQHAERIRQLRWEHELEREHECADQRLALATMFPFLVIVTAGLWPALGSRKGYLVRQVCRLLCHKAGVRQREIEMELGGLHQSRGGVHSHEEVLPRLAKPAHGGNRQVKPECCALSMTQFLLFCESCMLTETWRERSASAGLDTGACVSGYDVCEHFVKPWTRGTGCSVSLLMNPTPKRAELMISHGDPSHPRRALWSAAVGC